MALDENVRERIDSLVQGHRVMVFMKGSRHMPMCGFSGAVVQVLDSLVPEYETFNVLSDPAIREGIKAYSQWPTIPQLYVNGEFVGGCDIVREMYQSGELQRLLGVEVPEVAVPKVTLTDAARQAVRAAAQDAEPGAGDLRVEIGPRFEYALSFDAARPGDVAVDLNGLVLRFDRASAPRADGMVIDYTDADGGGFKIDNPNEPPKVQQLPPGALKRLLDGGTQLTLVDVRTPEERDIARIEGSELLDAQSEQALAALPKDTKLVFYCHHGGRSQQAAERFLGQGFKDVSNLAGGIDAWSREVDPDVPRY